MTALLVLTLTDPSGGVHTFTPPQVVQDEIAKRLDGVDDNVRQMVLESIQQKAVEVTPVRTLSLLDGMWNKILEVTTSKM